MRDAKPAILSAGDTIWIAEDKRVFNPFLGPDVFSKYSALLVKRDLDRKSKAM